MVRKFKKSLDLLLVEDNPADVRLVQEALDVDNQSTVVHHVEDGEAALEFLRREGEYADVPRPDLVLLDLNLPRIDGREVLAEMKADEDLHRIPVVVLSVSDNVDDIRASYDLHANSYITKPGDPVVFNQAVGKAMTFWLKASHLPGS